MRIVVTGATGNIGTSLVRVLAADARVDAVVGVARRPPADPGAEAPGVEWRQADVAGENLRQLVAGAHAVVHLAWEIQPSRDQARLWRSNVLGSERVARAAAAAGAALVHASSVGVYSAGPKDRPVDESWPRQGVRSNHYARQKAEVERRLDGLEREHPELRVVRLRPGFVLKRAAAPRILDLFAGRLLPPALLRGSRLPVVPDIAGLRVQMVHTSDVANAFAMAALGDARGAFNVAAEPVIDTATVARLLGARPVPLPAGLARALMAASWRLRLQPSPPSWLDVALGIPLMDTRRAREELGWTPRMDAGSALLDVLDAAEGGAGIPAEALEREGAGSA